MKTRRHRMKRRKTFRKGGANSGPMRRTPAKDRAEALSPVPVRVPKPKPKSIFDNPLQHVIHGLGDHELLSEFAFFNGKDNCQVLEGRTRNTPIPSDFSGIAFDGGHWKGYEKQVPGTPRKIYDSYVYNIQSPRSNNFCQSYATYLWAKSGNITPFVAGKYVENVQKMSQIWLNFIYSITKSTNAQMKIWLNNSISEGSKKSQSENEGSYTLSEIISTLERLKVDRSYAGDFANSY